LEDAILSLRMTKEGEEALYKYAYSYFYMKDYILAGYYFRKYVEDYPKGKYAEESQFMSAHCYYLDAPKYKLDQSATITALQEFELFITKYPNSQKINECNEYIDMLRDNLELKSYENAKIYYDIGYYGAAGIAFQNSIREFPDTKYKEDIYYYILLSNYKYAKNSIISKQIERYEKTISSYKKLIEKFPQSKYLKEIETIFKISQKEIIKLKEIKLS
jgi:outer membrane protein assembly factor BamD